MELIASAPWREAARDNTRQRVGQLTERHEPVVFARHNL